MAGKTTTPETPATEPEGWRPEPGSTVTGKVTEIAKGWSDYTNSYYPIVTIEQEDGKLTAVHCFHEILKQRMLDARPTVGMEIEVTCGDRKETRDGKRSYVTYKVTIPGEDGSNVWADLGAQAKPAAANQGEQLGLQGNDEDIPF